MCRASRRRARSSTTSAPPAQKNATGYASFLGAGAYRHYRPVIIDSLVQRGEFLTSYTPYQAEITQGTLQAIFEFQTMIAELTGMDVANASMYDGSTGAAEAVMMAVRVTGRHKAVVARRCIPSTAKCWPPTPSTRACRRRWLATTQNRPRRSGRSKPQVTEETACVLVQSPNFFGVIEDIPAIAEIAHAKGALLIVSIAEAVSLGVVRPPVEADIVSMEAQSFGVALSYGGPFCGVIAAKEQYLRQMPGRLGGQTVDGNGYRGFVLTLLHARAAHPAREGDLEHLHQPGIGGADGDDLSWRSMAKKACASWPSTTWPRPTTRPRRSSAQPGAKLRFSRRAALPRVCARDRRSAGAWSQRLLDNKIVGGIELSRWYPELYKLSW
jgi:glycine dehydrogenase subunit 1